MKEAPPIGTDCPLCSSAAAVTVVETPPHLAPDRGERFRWVRCRRCRLVRLANPPDPEEMGRYYGPGYLPHRGPEAWGRWAPLVRRSERGRDRRRVRWARRAVTRVAEPGLCDLSRPRGMSPGDPLARERLEGAPAPRREDGPGSSGGPGTARGSVKALDVGCGRPTFLRALGDATGWETTGLDTSDAGWAGDEPDTWSGLDLRVGEVEEACLPDGSFDLITLWHVLEHISDPLPFLERLGELAQPGSALVVEVPDHASWPRRLQKESWIGYDTPRHAVAYEPQTLSRMLEKAGWRVRQLRRWGTLDPWVLWWLGRQVARGRALDGPLERDFLPFVVGKILTLPAVALQQWVPLGAITAVASREGE